MDITSLGKHWVDITVAWLMIIKVLTGIQDACDAEPAELKPPFGRIIYYMKAISGYLFIGNRIKPITGGANVQTSFTDSSNTTVSIK